MWKKFQEFCSRESKNPTNYDVPQALKYLKSLEGRSKSYILQARCAISQTWKEIYPDEKPLTEHPLCARLTKALKERNPQRPNEKEKETWDVKKVLDHLKEIDSEKAGLERVSGKAVTLLALATFWRPRSDLARIQLQDVSFSNEKVRIICTKPKEGDFKETSISYYEAEPEICPVKTLKIYLERTGERREKTKALFITHKKPYRDATADTLARWISSILKETGINARPHSTRGVAASNALHAGMPIESVLEKANWKSANTFKKFYLRPPENNPIRVHGVNEGHTTINESE